jgi:hypothetical protein
MNLKCYHFLGFFLMKYANLKSSKTCSPLSDLWLDSYKNLNQYQDLHTLCATKFYGWVPQNDVLGRVVKINVNSSI